MKVRKAKEIAREWVCAYAQGKKWFKGAYFSGSAAEQADTSYLAPHSDLDIMVVTSLEEPPLKIGKFRHKGVLLEVSYIPERALSSSEAVLSHYHIAHAFQTDTIIVDLEGFLKPLQKEVSRQFCQEQWVKRRLDDVRSKSERGLEQLHVKKPFHELVMNWLFPTGVVAHLFLVAALRNPTVRLRYLAAKEVLTSYQLEDVYEHLLSQLGCQHMDAKQSKRHLTALAHTFDVTVKLKKTPFFFSSDISQEARPLAVDGTEKLINEGHHREAIFWIIATFARCHMILAVDGPTSHKAEFGYFQAALADIGIANHADLLKKAAYTRSEIGTMHEAALNILERNPAIVCK